MSEIGQSSGPFVQVASFCQAALTEQNGILSLVRITDRVSVTGTAPDMAPTPIQNLTLVIVLKAGFMRGRYSIKLTTTINEQLIGEVELPVLFEGEDRGIGIILPIAFIAKEEGVYWFDVSLVEGLVPLTRIPLRVMYQRLPQFGPPPATT